MTMPVSAERVTARRATFALCCFLIICVFGSFLTSTPAARGQDGGDGEAKTADAAPPPAARAESLFMASCSCLSPSR
jgi:hypothetical protein